LCGGKVDVAFWTSIFNSLSTSLINFSNPSVE